MPVIIFICLIWICLFIYYNIRKPKKIIEPEKINSIPINRNYTGDLTKSKSVIDFSIHEMSLSKDCLYITLLLHNFTEQFLKIDLKEVYYISSQTNTQFTGDCTRLVEMRVNGDKLLDNNVLPNRNIKRETSFFRFDLRQFFDDDLIIIRLLVNNELVTVSKYIYESSVKEVKII